MTKFISWLVALGLLTIVPNIQAANPIPAVAAAAHVGQTVTIQGKVAEVKVLKNDEAFLRVGAPYPHQLITGYIEALKTVADESWLNSFDGQTVIYAEKSTCIVENWKSKSRLATRLALFDSHLH